LSEKLQQIAISLNKVPSLKVFIFLCALAPVLSEASFLGRCIGALKASIIKKTLSPDEEFELEKEYLIVYGRQESARVKFLGAKHSDRTEFLDDFQFLNLDTGEILKIKRVELLDSVPGSIKKNRTYKKNVPYKIHSIDGEIVNGIFLGEYQSRSKHQALDGSLVFYDLNTRAIRYYDDADIFQIVRDDDARYINELGETTSFFRGLPLHDDVYEPVDPLRKTKGLEFTIKKGELDSLSAEQKQTLQTFMDQVEYSLEKYDSAMKGVLGPQNVSKRIQVRFLPDTNGNAYTYDSKVEVAGDEKLFIRLPLDKSRSDLGLSVGVFLHERGHHYGTNATLSVKNEIGLLEDSGFREGLSDYFAAHIQGDPAVGRYHFADQLWLRHLENRTVLSGGKNVVMRSPLDASVGGELEAHHLSIFYSYPMWSAFKHHIRGQHRSKVSPTDLWKSMHSKMDANYNSYQEYLQGRRDPDALALTEESELLSNLQFFYVHLYKEAFLSEGVHDPKVIASMQFAYQQANKKFIMPWKEIERIANSLKSIEDIDRQQGPDSSTNTILE